MSIAPPTAIRLQLGEQLLFGEIYDPHQDHWIDLDRGRRSRFIRLLRSAIGKLFAERKRQSSPPGLPVGNLLAVECWSQRKTALEKVHWPVSELLPVFTDCIAQAIGAPGRRFRSDPIPIPSRQDRFVATALWDSPVDVLFQACLNRVVDRLTPAQQTAVQAIVDLSTATISRGPIHVERLRSDLQKLNAFCDSAGGVVSEQITRLRPRFDNLKIDPDERSVVSARIEELRELAQRLAQSDHSESQPTEPLVAGNWRAFFNTFASRRKTLPLSSAIAEFQEFLRLQAGNRFGTLAENKAFAKAVNDTMIALNCRAKCPGTPPEPCGLPANFRCQEIGNNKLGLFLFTHRANDRNQMHGFSSTVPQIALCEPGPRKRARPARAAPRKRG
jgi:hypothetical protein